MNEAQRKIVAEEFEKLAEAPYLTLKEMKLANLDVNPFLLRALGLSTPEAIAEFMVAQRMERSLVTGFGFKIQTIAKAFTGGTGTAGSDIRFVKGGKTYEM